MSMFLQRFDPARYPAPVPPDDPRMVLRYLGTAGFVIEAGGRTLVLDPYLSRPGLWASGLCRLRPDVALIRRIVPVADDVLIGHAHVDHVLDAPTLCQQTGARFIGGDSACNVARAAGLPESQIHPTAGGQDIACGEVTVRGLPSRHGRVILGRVTVPGFITEPPPWPPRTWALRHGEVFNWRVDYAGLTVVFIGSADFIDDELRDTRADVLCLCAVGRRYRPGYVHDAVALLQPRVVVPTHWDWFMAPYDRPPRFTPGVDLDGMVDELRGAGVEPVVLPFGGRLAVG